MAIDPKELWKAIKNNERMMSLLQSEEQKMVLKEYIENGFLVAVGDIIDRPVNAKSTIDMQLAYLKDALSNGLFVNLAKAAPKEELTFISIDGVIEMFVGLMAQAVEMLEPIAKDIPAFLKENGFSEEQILIQLNVNKYNIKKANKGNLTIGDLLLSQPDVFLDTNKE
ncbi:hypothetical protein K8R32_04375 [bacterium]|nr:hypothetical protein [bacterium]